jgi:hypothetical protein
MIITFFQCIYNAWEDVQKLAGKVEIVSEAL